MLGTNHIKRNKAAKTLFSKTKNSRKSPLFLPENADVCLRGVQKYAMYF